MEEQLKYDGEFAEVNFKRLLNAVLNKTWLVMIASILGAVMVFLFTHFFVTPLYESSAMFYVNNSAISVGEASFSIDSGDISASKSLVKTYIVILNTRETMNEVIDYADVDRSFSEMTEMIEAESVDETEVFQVVVTSPDPEEANKIAEAIAHILPKRITSIVEGSSAKVVDSAVIPSKPSSPNYTTNTLIGFLLGLVLSAGWIVLKELFDITIRTEEDIVQITKLPVLTSVPDMMSRSKGGYYYGNDHKKLSKVQNPNALVGDDIPFAAAEAYKLLRTKLMFSFADDSDCHVLGISSALSGEGKSLSAVNLAYTLSQLGKKVLLIDCDMRRPTLADKLKIQKKPGLSNYLIGQIGPDHLIQYCGISNDERAFHVISAGECPPNPIELLSSEKMSISIQSLRKMYNYIILDLPPVGEVSDALSVAKLTDGMLLVVRENYCNRLILKDTVRQFAFIHSKILGVVVNCTVESSGAYSKRYNKKYYQKYADSYAKSSQAAKNKQKSKGKK